MLKAGAEGESPCVLGTAQSGEDLKPGEVRLRGVECALHLGQGQAELTGGEGCLRLGEQGMELTGGLSLNGQPLEEIVRKIAQEVAREVVEQFLGRAGG